MSNKVAAVIEVIATAILFAAFRQTWILGIGLGLVWSAVTAEVVEEDLDETVRVAIFAYAGCIGCTLVRIIFPEDIGASIFYGIASLCNAALCAGLSGVFFENSYARLNRRTRIRSERDAIRYSRERDSIGFFNILFIIINVIVYLILAFFGFAAPAAGFLPLIWLTVRSVFVGIRLKMR